MNTTSTPALGRALRAVLYGAIVLTCARVWIGPMPLTESAYGQIPDSGAQRKAIVEELEQTNLTLLAIRNQLAEIHKILATGTLNVRTAAADK
ncbi:MAG: hypothetical protein IID36_01365 [Planctomycetes bacterium]|nr:hypothetical protein [Planctomycetota bacterium]